MENKQHIHLVGIGGAGLSGIARVLLQQGYKVSGSDMVKSALIEELAREGAHISIGHHPGNVHSAELVLVSTAVPRDNPEVLEAKRLGLRVLDRRQFFAHWTSEKKVVAVAGTHGKTTTSAMLALILEGVGWDPAFIVGGVIPELDTNAKAGKSEYWVLEADEYQRAFLGLHPQILVVTNIEMDHPDYFQDEADAFSAFLELARQVTEDGVLIYCRDDLLARNLANEKLSAQTIGYGLIPGQGWIAQEITLNTRGGSNFQVSRDGQSIGQFSLSIPGRHNVQNALAVFAVAQSLGIDLPSAGDILAGFHGVVRRFQVKGEAAGILVIDDYAHHPSEIRSTLAAARERYKERKIVAVFQPHTFSRTRSLLPEFASALQGADLVLVSDIYPARETNNGSVHARDLVAAIGPKAVYGGSLEVTLQETLQSVGKGDVLLTLGAGDVWKIGEQVLNRLAINKEKRDP